MRERSMGPSAAVWLLWFSAAAVACEGKPARPSQPAAPPGQVAPVRPDEASSAQPDPSQALAEAPAEHMRDHFGIVTQARDALIRGDLQQAQGPLIWLAQHNYHGDVPPAWEPHVARMQAAARRAEAATTTETLARELVALAQACGACHAALGKVPTLEPAGYEDLDAQHSEPTRTRMHRHLWAVSRMWEALIGPAPERFAVAGEVLAEAPKLSGAPSALQPELESVAALAKRARSAATATLQAQLLADFLGRCAGCHQRAGALSP